MIKKAFYIVLAVLVIGYIWYIEWKKNRPSVPQVRIDTVVEGKLTSSVLTTGMIVSKDESTVFAKTAGIVSDVLVNEGDTVKKGDLLVEYQQMVALNALAQATDQVALAQVNFEDAQDKYSRAKELYNTKGIPEIKVNEAENMLNRTKIQLNIANRQLELTEKKIKDFTLASPQDGTVLKKVPSAGSATAPGSPMFIIANTEDLEIEANIDEVDASSITKEQKVIISSAILPEKEFPGTITEIAHNATVQKSITVIKTTISPVGDLPLKIGNIVYLEIITHEKDAVLYVPIESVHESNDKKFVYIFKRKRAESRPVKTGISNFNYIEITDGVSEGEKIIVSSDKTLKNNDKVNNIKDNDD